MTAPRRSVTLAAVPVWAVACFLLSGAAGLIHEVIWSKQLGYLLGSSLHSVATVTAAFLGGLALGAYALGPRLVRQGDPALRYAQLEGVVALLGVALLPLLRSLDGPIGVLWRACGGEGPAFAVARVVLLFALLVPPAALMGATLPVLVARCERGVLGAGLAWLYAINTAGAVLGSLLAGFVLLPSVGLQASAAIAAGLNLTAAAIAFLVGREGRSASVTAASAPIPATLTRPAARRAVGLAFALSGFAAMALQAAWVRMYSLVLGSSVYSFASVLGVYLTGLALGSALVSPVLPRVATVVGFALLETAFALSALLAQRLDGGLPRAMLEAGERMGTSWTGLLTAQLGLVVPVLLVPCVLLGAIFPVATRLLQHDEGATATGRAYALNTLGTIAGALLTGFLLLPALGVQGVVKLAAGLSVLAALVPFAIPAVPRPRARLAWGLGLMLAAVPVAMLTLPAWDPVRMSLGTYRPFSARNLMTSWRSAGAAGDPTLAVSGAQRRLFYREGVNASVLVSTDLEGRRRWLRVGGKIDAGTGDMLTQVLLGLVPASMVDRGARTLIVGHGSGTTAAAALAAGVGRTDVVELEPAILEASRLFHEGRPDPLDDPRVTAHVEDARTWLAHTRDRYDLIISEPTNPWIAGVNALFTTDFYDRVRARLAPEGVFCQWLQVYELSPESFHSLLAAFATRFPEAHLFFLWRSSDLLLVAGPPDRTLALDRLARAEVAPLLAEARLTRPDDLAAFDLGPLTDLRPVLEDAPANRDDHPFVEYRAPRDLIEVGRAEQSPHPGVIASLPRRLAPPTTGPLRDWPYDVRVAARARMMFDDRAGRLDETWWRDLRASGADRLADSLARVAAARDREARIAELFDTARARAAQGDAAGTRAAFESLVALDAATPAVWRALAQARSEAGDRTGAIVAARRALAALTGSERLEPLLVLGAAQWQLQQATDALGSAREAQTIAPLDPRGYDLEARIRVSLGDARGALAAIERGLARTPSDPSLLQARLALTARR